MRTNLPATQCEHPFPVGSTLVSTTDLNGRMLILLDIVKLMGGAEMGLPAEAVH